MFSSIEINDSVALIRDIPGRSLRRGDLGQVLEEIDLDMFLVEFRDEFGRAFACAELPSHDLLRLAYSPLSVAGAAPEPAGSSSGAFRPYMA